MAEYIDRKALENAMTIAAANGKEKDCRVWARAICLLYDVQTADVEPVVHGKWVYGEDVDIECSVCGRDALTEGDYRQVRSNYCPHCGAKMDLEEQNNA